MFRFIRNFVLNTVLRRDHKNHWRTTVDGTRYSITIENRMVRLTKDDGSPETYGGNDIPIRRFLRGDQWQQHIAKVFGEAILSEVLSAAEIAASQPSGIGR